MITSLQALNHLTMGSSMPASNLAEAAEELAKKVASGNVYAETFADVWFAYLAGIANAHRADLGRAADAIAAAAAGGQAAAASGIGHRISLMTEIEKAQMLRDLAGSRRFSIQLFASLALDYSLTFGLLEKAQSAFHQPSAVPSR